MPLIAGFGMLIHTKSRRTKILTTLMVMMITVVAGLTASAQERDARSWTLSHSWSNGFDALPDVCTDLDEFQSQYMKNRTQWDAMFKWLATHDLTAIEKGKHPIEGTDLVVSVEDSENGTLEKRHSESHYHHIDFQYVVKGTEGFALIDHASSKPDCEYKPDVIHYDYEKSKAMFFRSTPKRFMLFFPGDWHIAKIATQEESQVIRVIVVKLDYVE